MTERKHVGKAMQWKAGEDFHVGFPLQFLDGNNVYDWKEIDGQAFHVTLMMHDPSGELEWVKTSSLAKYPSEPIPEPTK